MRRQAGGLPDAASRYGATTRLGAGPPPRVRLREDDSSNTIEGEYEFLMEGHTFRAGSGSLIYVPKGALHAHTTHLVSSTLVWETDLPGCRLVRRGPQTIRRALNHSCPKSVWTPGSEAARLTSMLPTGKRSEWSSSLVHPKPGPAPRASNEVHPRTSSFTLLRSSFISRILHARVWIVCRDLSNKLIAQSPSATGCALHKTSIRGGC